MKKLAKGKFRTSLAAINPSPTEVMLKAGPRGNGNWPGFDAVYRKIQYAVHKMAASSSYLSEAHIETMADLGSGHEERMKYRLHWLMTYGWLDGYGEGGR